MITRLLVVIGVAMSIHASYAQDKPKCKRVKGDIVVGWSTENCTSPFGLCTAGTIKSNGFLNGAQTHYTVTNIGPTPNDPGMADSLVYTGVLEIKTRKGTLTIDDMGVFDKVNGLISSQNRGISSADNALEGATGAFFTYGTATATGFDSRIAGQICIDR